MKNLITILALAIMLMASTAWAGTNISFMWDKNTEVDLAGYNIYQSDESGVYDISKLVGTITAPDVTFTLNDISDGVHYWVVTAFDTSGNESGYSNEVTFSGDTIAPENPQALTITITIKVEGN